MTSHNYSAHHIVPTRVWDDKAKGFVTISVELDFDLGAIAFNMGKKARWNKSGKARLMSGAIIARVRS
jgi:hypothetical protein